MSARSNEYAIRPLIDHFNRIYLLQCLEPIADFGRRHRAGESSLLKCGGHDNLWPRVTIDCIDHILQRLAHELQCPVAP